MQYTLNPFSINCKIMMTIVIFVSIMRTLEMFRIFPLYAPTTKMVFQVISAMKKFILALLILVFMMSMLITTFELDVKLFKYDQSISNIMMSLWTAFGKA